MPFDEASKLRVMSVMELPSYNLIIPRLGRSLGEGNGYQFTPIFLPGEFHGQRSLVRYSPWDCIESEMTEYLKFSHSHYNKFIKTEFIKNLFVVPISDNKASKWSENHAK